MLKNGPQPSGKEEALEKHQEFTPQRRVYTIRQMRQWQPVDGPDYNTLRNIATAGVLRTPKAKL